MTVKAMLNELIAQRRNLDEAIGALQKLSETNSTGVTAALGGNGRRRRRKLSEEAKQRISEMMKKRWAERKRTKSA